MPSNLLFFVVVIAGEVMYTRKGLHEVLSIVMIFMIVCGSAAALQPASNVTIRQEPGSKFIL